MSVVTRRVEIFSPTDAKLRWQVFDDPVQFRDLILERYYELANDYVGRFIHFNPGDYTDIFTEIPTNQRITEDGRVAYASGDETKLIFKVHDDGELEILYEVVLQERPQDEISKLSIALIGLAARPENQNYRNILANNGIKFV